MAAGAAGGEEVAAEGGVAPQRKRRPVTLHHGLPLNRYRAKQLQRPVGRRGVGVGAQHVGPAGGKVGAVDVAIGDHYEDG